MWLILGNFVSPEECVMVEDNSFRLNSMIHGFRQVVSS